MNDQRITDRDIKAAFVARAAGAPNLDLAARISADAARTRQSRHFLVLPGLASQAATRLAWAAFLTALSVALVGALAFGVGSNPITSVVPSESPARSDAPIATRSADPSQPPSPSVEPAGEAVAEASDELFRLIVRSPASAYAPGQQIDVTADVIYVGPGDAETIYHAASPVGWRITQLDGPAAMEGGMDLPCLTTALDAEEPLRLPFQKAGGIDDTGPFTRAWFEEPGLQLPAGRWRITAEMNVALGDCAGAAHRLSAAIDLVVGQPTTEASPTATPSSSPGSPFVAAELRPDTIGRVVATDGLRVRTLPTVGETSERLEPMLDEGVKFYVVDGPVMADGYAWYQVDPYLNPRDEAGMPFGWVAAGSREGEPWIENYLDGCDSIYPSIEMLTSGPSQENLYCSLGQPPLELTGNLICDFGEFEGLSSGPEWLESDRYCLLRGPDWNIGYEGDTLRVWGKAATSLLDYGSPVDGQYTVIGHFDDPGAAECVSSDTAQDPAEAVLYCRMQFVVTEVGPA